MADPITYETLDNSTYLDFVGYRSNGTLPTDGQDVDGFVLNVALVLQRASDPTALLESDWATRQTTLAELNANDTLWSTYGAAQQDYQTTKDVLTDLNVTLLGDANGSDGYVSSQQSRMIWVQLDKAQFQELFNTTLKEGTTPTGETTWFWEGSLSLPERVVEAGVAGLWFDDQRFQQTLANPGSGAGVTLPQGWQSPGNGADNENITVLSPHDISRLYNYPLSGALWNTVPTGAIGLIEAGAGVTLEGSHTLLAERLDHYRRELGVTAGVDAIGVQPAGTFFDSSGERSLDIGIATAVNPRSPLILYAGSGPDVTGGRANTLTAYQAAVWDTTNKPAVITSSQAYQEQTAPGSPFYFASHELYVDAALRNISFFSAAGDGGSGEIYGNGLTNISASRSSYYTVMVGGTSLVTTHSGLADTTLSDIVGLALAGDATTLWQLVGGGLKVMPSASDDGAVLVETIWNGYYVDGNTIARPISGSGYLLNNTGGGGVDSSQAPPWYQTAFGLSPTTPDPQHLVGRGVPDVSADAGGDMHYTVPSVSMEGTGAGAGTSAATPFWASLAVQLNAIFHDQGLPSLGFMNDLLYIAAAVAPASFNDVTLGSNVSSFVYGGPYTSDGTHITPTGYGYYAGPGYDLTSGLGSPNGTLLARALSSIAHSQMHFNDQPAVIDSDGQGGWTSGADQSLLFQTMSDATTRVGVDFGPDAFDLFSSASGTFAWPSRLAEQSLQADFDPNLVRLFDKFGQGALGQAALSSGESLSVSINGTPGQAVQATLTSAFGFADFMTSAGVVRVAQPVAVAETAGGLDDQVAVVRLRQNGEDSLSLSFYRVDDLSGTINGLHPGEAGYEAATLARTYQSTTGGTSLSGPGYGNHAQAALADVDAGDLIAMRLTNNTSGDTYWAFSQANETVNGQHVGHLWNYGLNTWGWEDLHDGGDRDFNDLVVQLDFTSASGHGWLV